MNIDKLKHKFDFFIEVQEKHQEIFGPLVEEAWKVYAKWATEAKRATSSFYDHGYPQHYDSWESEYNGVNVKWSVYRGCGEYEKGDTFLPIDRILDPTVRDKWIEEQKKIIEAGNAKKRAYAEAEALRKLAYAQKELDELKGKQ